MFISLIIVRIRGGGNTDLCGFGILGGVLLLGYPIEPLVRRRGIAQLSVFIEEGITCCKI